MPSQTHQLDREKLKEAVLLIASLCPPVKMHKALYFSDMTHFLSEARPITGVDYLKQKFGPVARHLTQALGQLQREGRLEVREDEYFGLPKKTYVPKKPYEQQRLSDLEVSIIREMTDFVRGKSAREISAFSHNAAWEAVGWGETIPYFTALRLIPTEVDDSDREWAAEWALEHAAERFRPPA
jgi:hypothetical protein